MEWLVVLALVAFVLLAKLSQASGEKAPRKKVVYERQELLFSAAERSFYGVLTQAVAGKALVFGKVRVADVLRPPQGMDRAAWFKAFNLISAKHFDYVLCDPNTLRVLSVIELDDSSHNNKDRIKRDNFLEDACKGANLPLHRFKAAFNYQISEVRLVLFPSAPPSSTPSALASSTPLPVSAPDTPLLTTQPPSTQRPSQPLQHQPFKHGITTATMDYNHHRCPKCGSSLVKKIAKKGQHKGKAFMACSAYPKCRYVGKLPIADQVIAQ
ncbi:MAG: DUF2726 domain-containing protein [Pontibacterium sp.]